MLILVILSHLGNHTIFNILLLYIIYSLLYSYFLLFSHVFFFIIISYLFSTFTDTIRKPMKIGCADGVCSHLNHVLTASSASDSACSEQLLPSILFSRIRDLVMLTVFALHHSPESRISLNLLYFHHDLLRNPEFRYTAVYFCIMNTK